jgi:pimeloyl-ACP methyl ester carboxylesterase
MSTALLLIDVQQSFKHRPYWSENDLPAFLAASNALISGCMAQRIPIVRVFHTDGPNSADNAFAPASGLIRPLDGLAPFDGPVLWLAGGDSDYVRSEQEAEMRRLFPRVRKVVVKGAGHWVHSQRPEVVVEALRQLTS